MSVSRRTGPSTARAWDVPATRSYWRRLMALVLVPAILGVGLLVAAVVSWNTGREASNARTAQAPGVVTDVNSRRVGRGGVENGDITVEFSTGSEPQRVVMNVGADVVRYSTGQAVTVRFEPSNPSNASVAGSAAASSNWAVLAMFGVAIVATMGWIGRHVRRMRRVLERYPWQARPSRIGEVPFRAGFRVRAQIVVVLWDPVDEHETVVMPMGVRRLNPSFQPVTWLCGDIAAERVVIAPPGGKPPLLARRVIA